MYEDRIIDIETRCEAPETDTYFEGAHLTAEYDADYDCTEISGQTYACKDAIKGLDGARWTGSARARKAWETRRRELYRQRRAA